MKKLASRLLSLFNQQILTPTLWVIKHHWAFLSRGFLILKEIWLNRKIRIQRIWQSFIFAFVTLYFNHELIIVSGFAFSVLITSLYVLALIYGIGRVREQTISYSSFAWGYIACIISIPIFINILIVLSSALWPVSLTIATGPDGGSYVETSKKLQSLFVTHSHIHFDPFGIALGDFNEGYQPKFEFNMYAPREWQLTHQNYKSGNSQTDLYHTKGSEENYALLEKGAADLAITQDSRPPYNNSRVLMRLFDSPLQIIVRTQDNIRGLSDLKGKKIFTGGSGSRTQFLVLQLLEQAGLNQQDFTQAEYSDENNIIPLSFNGAIDLLAEKQSGISAVCIMASLKNPAITRIAAVIDNTNGQHIYDSIPPLLFTTIPFFSDQQSLEAVIDNIPKQPQCTFTLLNLGDLAKGFVESNPNYILMEIDPGAYPSASQFPNKQVFTVGAHDVLLCRKDLSDSYIYNIVKTIVAHNNELEDVAPMSGQLSPQEEEKTLYPQHPGASAFFRQKGIRSMSPLSIVAVTIILLPLLYEYTQKAIKQIHERVSVKDEKEAIKAIKEEIKCSKSMSVADTEEYNHLLKQLELLNEQELITSQISFADYRNVQASIQAVRDLLNPPVRPSP